MIDFRPILLVIGKMLVALGCIMLVPAIIDFTMENKIWQFFVASSLLTTMIGGVVWIATTAKNSNLNRRQAFILTVLIWIVLVTFGAIPIYWSAEVPTFTMAFFESMSGFTTTGATVITDLDSAPMGLLFWRALLQWLGGIGIIVMAVAVLPQLQVGGMQIFKAEAFDTPEKILPHAKHIAGGFMLVFVGLTIVCALLYRVAGMTLSDAILHAMTTLATGGFSSKDSSFAHFDSVAIESIAIVFMCIGSLPFILYIRMAQGQAISLFKDDQVKAFFLLIMFFTAIVWIYQAFTGLFSGFEGLRYSAFNVVSIMTGTGYASANYSSWGAFSTAVFFVLMFIGGCAGSTSCGIKVFRFQVLLETVRLHINRIVYPNGVFVSKFNGNRIDESVSAAVMSCFFLYLLGFALASVLLSLTGVETITALSGAATAIANVGPGLGEIIGPSGNFKEVNKTALWILSFSMLLGRLEFLTVLVLFVPSFWRH